MGRPRNFTNASPPTLSNADRALLHQCLPEGGDADDLADALRLGANPDAVDEKGARPIHLASEPDKIRKLSEAGADLDAVWTRIHRDGSRRELRALDIALRDEDRPRFKALLECGASLSLAGAADNDLGLTPAMAAAACGDLEALRLCAATASAANASDRQGRSALYFALLSRRLETTQTLLELGASPVSADMLADPSRARPKNALFHSAARIALGEHFEALVLGGQASITPEIARELVLAAVHYEGPAIEILCKHCRDKLSTNPADYRGDPVYLAIADANPSGLRALLALGFDPNGSRDGMLYIESAASEGDSEICDILLAAGALPTRAAVEFAEASHFRNSRGASHGELATRLDAIVSALEEKHLIAEQAPDRTAELPALRPKSRL